MTYKEFSKLRDEAYSTAKEHGFHDEELSTEHLLGLVLSEVGEAINADRNPRAPKPTNATVDEALRLAGKKDDQHVAFVTYFREHIKGSVVEELADIAIRLLDLAGEKGIDYIEGGEAYIPPKKYKTLPEALFNFSMSLDWLHLGVTDYHDYMLSLDLISNIAKQFTHIDFLAVVRLKMLYNKTRPRYNGKKY